jgi:Transposase IS66 family
MADHVGAGAAVLTPLYELIKAHVFAAERIHGDDTTVPVLAKIKTRTGRLWAYVRDDRPFGAEPIRPRLCSSTHPIGPVSTPPAASRRIFRVSAGRRLCRVQHGLQAGSKARPDHGSGMLGSRKTRVL